MSKKYDPRLHGVRCRIKHADGKEEYTLQFPLDDFDLGYNNKYESVLDSEKKGG